MKHFKNLGLGEFESDWSSMRAGVIALGVEPIANQFEDVAHGEGHAIFDGALAGDRFGCF